MHTSFRVGNTTIMASDGQCSGNATFEGFALSLSAAAPEEATRLFNALAEGGEIRMPLTKTFWSPCFGMLADRFGVSWMVIVPQ
jgi:PhnB protein